MNTAQIGVIVAIAMIGGGSAYLIWILFDAVRIRNRATVPEDDNDLDPEETTDPVNPDTQMPLFPDPTLIAQVAAVRRDMNDLAKAQAEILEHMANWENRFLAEMRAVASVRDPESTIVLNRIVRHLGIPPLESSAPPDPAAPPDTPTSRPESSEEPDRPPPWSA